MTDLTINGYLVQNKDKFEAKYICLVCTNLLKVPVQMKCGHRVCQACIQSKNNYVKCLECQLETKTSEIIFDKGFQRDMQTLEVICKLCQWLGPLRNYQDHLEQSHKQYKCEHCNEIFNALPSLEDHTNNSCSKLLMNCVLQLYGCKHQFLRGDREDHYKSEDHQRAVMCCFNQINTQLIEQCYISDIPETNMEMETSDVSYKTTTTTATTAPGATEKFSDDLKNLYDTIDLLSSGTHTLKDELKSLDSESVQQSQSLEMADKLLETTKTSIEESSGLLAAINTNILILQQNLSLLKQTYEDQQVTSYDGTLVWKITQFQDKMNDAKSERQVSIYSPPFRSSATGYKMRARLYLYGDGNARRTHMSLFFVIMRSPHDSILQFPFSYKVTFCLYDQTPQQRHIIDSFRPDTKSNSFQRPRSDMNIASGIPKFVPLSIFENLDNPYVKEDAMFIKVMVDFENMPKAVLPYALSLNPGLSMYAQQKLIRQEMERKAQPSQSTTQTTPPSKDTKKN